MLHQANGAWAVACDRCKVVQQLPTATRIEEARTAATAAGWMDQARRGKRLAAWAWLCPACRPATGGKGVIGPST